MKETLYDFITKYLQKNPTRLHMPGHKGVCKFLNPLGGNRDITELPGADFLYRPQGRILDLERRYGDLYGSDCFLSTQGSTLCIQTMLCLIKGRPGKILAARNAHASFFHSCALLDIQPVLLPLEIDPHSQLPAPITVKQIQKKVQEEPDISSIYLTSPDYYGQMAPIADIANYCRQNNLLLLIDNAHGAHLAFLSQNQHPIALGADLCCDSLHKTLPALTGSALLHSKKGRFCPGQIHSFAALFGSSSPSYLILQSMDLCEQYLRKNGKAVFSKWEQKRGLWPYERPTNDPIKLVLDAHQTGKTGKQLMEYLRQQRIEGEYADDRYVLLLLSPLLRKKDEQRLKRVLHSLSPASPPTHTTIDLSIPKQRKNLHQAVFGAQIRIPLKEAAGKISAESVYLCPPGISMILPGEELDEETVTQLKKAGISSINVLY